MSLHDAYARTTPHEVLFPDAAHAAEVCGAVEEEARVRSLDPSDPQAFLSLDAVQRFVDGLQAPDGPPEAWHRLALLAFHAVAFEREGRAVYLVSTPVLRSWAAPGAEDAPHPPTQAGYLQLPQHLVWLGQPDVAPQSVDGVLWTVAPGGVLHTMLAFGVRPERAGLGVVPLPEAPLADAAAWTTATARPTGDDFSSDLPGAALDDLIEVRTAGEVLKLVGRFFGFERARVGSERPEDRRSGEVVTGPSDVPASRFPFTRLVLDA